MSSVIDKLEALQQRSGDGPEANHQFHAAVLFNAASLIRLARAVLAEYNGGDAIEAGCQTCEALAPLIAEVPRE